MKKEIEVDEIIRALKKYPKLKNLFEESAAEEELPAKRLLACQEIQKIKEAQENILIPLRAEIAEAEGETKRKFSDYEEQLRKTNSLKVRLFSESTRLNLEVQKRENFLRLTAPDDLKGKIEILHSELEKCYRISYEECQTGELDLTTMRKSSEIFPDIFEVREKISKIKNEILEIEHQILNPGFVRHTDPAGIE